MKLNFAGAVVVAVCAGIALAHAQTSTLPAVAPADVDAVFAKYSATTPGCTVGVSQAGTPVVQRAYGLADLEHDVRNAADTIFEAGSVSKQFTAAAVLLLASDGKLSLDDPVRRYIPEVPEYGAPLTIRHLLTHTSGLRDWGSVAGIGGWPRTSRAYTHAHVLDIVSRQKSLNFTPGTRWSYSNTGYNLAAIIVARVSGKPFADFTRERIFLPLGMTRTSWRDDFTRVVKGRAIAYSEERDGFHADMPFENVHGNGGLLTTVGDLLRWTHNFAEPRVGSTAFVREEREAGRFSDGRQHDYGLGLFIGTYRGEREVSHGGATAGYRAYLADYPERGVSVAVLCNVDTANAAQLAHATADLFLPVATAEAPAATGTLAAEASVVSRLSGTYANTVTGEPVTINAAGGQLRATPGGQLRQASAGAFDLPNGAQWAIDESGGRLIDRFGRIDRFERVETGSTDPATLASYSGVYVSDEAEVALTAAVEGETLVLKRRPDTVIRLAPIYRDAFRGSIGLVRFRRNAAGQVDALSVSQDRVWDLRFVRQ